MADFGTVVGVYGLPVKAGPELMGELVLRGFAHPEQPTLTDIGLGYEGFIADGAEAAIFQLCTKSAFPAGNFPVYQFSPEFKRFIEEFGAFFTAFQFYVLIVVIAETEAAQFDTGQDVCPFALQVDPGLFHIDANQFTFFIVMMIVIMVIFFVMPVGSRRYAVFIVDLAERHTDKTFIAYPG